jgi:hypothetical protein
MENPETKSQSSLKLGSKTFVPKSKLKQGEPEVPQTQPNTQPPQENEAEI